jgi:hypothetical protein
MTAKSNSEYINELRNQFNKAASDPVPMIAYFVALSLILNDIEQGFEKLVAEDETAAIAYAKEKHDLLIGNDGNSFLDVIKPLRYGGGQEFMADILSTSVKNLGYTLGIYYR